MLKPDKSNESYAVFQLQDCLLLISRFDDTIPRVNPDGIYGVETENAVMSFQKARSLPVTGKVDYTTWLYLFAEYDSLNKVIANSRK